MYNFITNCINSTGPRIHVMQEQAREITRRTFLKYVNRGDLRAKESECGYAGHHTQGLTMAADCMVQYFKSMYCGKPCVYFYWSGIEYIFVKAGV